MERLMTSDEVAEYLRVEVVTVRRLVNRGELPAYRIGGEYRFTQPDLEDYVKRQRISGGTGAEASNNPLDQFTQWVRKTLQAKGITPADFVRSDRDRFDRFTKRARRVLTLAQEEAQRFQHNYIGTEHLLLGLIREGDGVAAKVLSNLGIDLNTVREAVEAIIGRGDRIVLGEMSLTPRSKKVIELAVDEARRLKHQYVGTEHLLLGLVREGEGIAAGVLESLGVKLEQVRTETIEVLRQHQKDDSPASPPIQMVEPELICSHCGTHCPSHFHYCFNCGQQLVSE